MNDIIQPNKIKEENIEKEIIISEGNGYFISSNEIDYPFKVTSKREMQLKELEQIFNSVYDKNSLNLAKTFSKEERERKNAKGLSFVYSEIVRNLYLNCKHRHLKRLLIL